MDYGLTNRELTRWLDKKEREEGNVKNKYVTPLLDAGLIYQVKMKDEYPRKRLYINKSLKNIIWLKSELANPVSGRIQQYQKAHHVEQKDYEKIKWSSKSDSVGLPISDKHLEIRTILGHCIHLYKWCNKVEEELHALLSKEKARIDFSMLPLRPHCRLCRDEMELIKTHEYFQEHQRIIFEDGAYNIGNLKFEPLRPI